MLKSNAVKQQIGKFSFLFSSQRRFTQPIKNMITSNSQRADFLITLWGNFHYQSYREYYTYPIDNQIVICLSKFSARLSGYQYEKD